VVKNNRHWFAVHITGKPWYLIPFLQATFGLEYYFSYDLLIVYIDYGLDK